MINVNAHVGQRKPNLRHKRNTQSGSEGLLLEIVGLEGMTESVRAGQTYRLTYGQILLKTEPRPQCFAAETRCYEAYVEVKKIRFRHKFPQHLHRHLQKETGL